MDVNSDGHVDILSGSYSRMEGGMAGLFQVLWGRADGTFAAPAALNGTDGEPLIIHAAEERVTDRICTRPTAVDLDGDGDLDIVSGNFSGTFAWFEGEGEGRFAPRHRLLESDGEPLRVDAHGDPFFVDWDGDGDLDLVSGSAGGGAFLFPNTGTRTAPAFGSRVELWPPIGHGDEDGGPRFGEAHLTGPQRDTRVWVDDVDGDGKLDLLLGDSVTLEYPADGLDEAAARAKLADWKKKERELVALIETTDGSQPSEAAMKRFQDEYGKHYEERETFLRSEMTGFVWLLRRK